MNPSRNGGAGPAEVSEVHGLYGPLLVAEGWVQQAWLKQQFSPGDIRTTDGERLRILFPGYWNHGGGPDFEDAVLEIAGERVRGDVEIHLYREDWWNHGHWSDPAYNRVVLHVIFFQPENIGGIMRLENGRGVPEWIMAPWIEGDLESLVEFGQAGEENIPPLLAWVRERNDPGDSREVLWRQARGRWKRKVEAARLLCREMGTRNALHALVLMVLGYPFNRGRFLELGMRYNRENWVSGTEMEKEILLEARRRWHWRGGRPSNHPERRLKQYLQMNSRVEDWPERMSRLADTGSARLPEAAASLGQTREIRKRLELGKRLRHAVLEKYLSGNLLNRIMVDAVLPWREASDPDLKLEVLWLHWLPGDAPDWFRDVARELGLGFREGFPSCNGWNQGMVGLEAELRCRRVGPGLPDAGEGWLDNE